MSYVTTGSSNSVLNGSPLELNVVISKVPSEDEPSDSIVPMGTFTVENLEAIAADGELSSLSCKLFGKLKSATDVTFSVLICELLHNPNNKGKRSFIIPKNYDDEFAYLILNITAKKCAIDGLSQKIPISFRNKKDKNSRDLNQIDFIAVAEEVKPEITDFSCNVPLANSIVVPINESINLLWTINGDKFILREGNNELTSGIKSGKGEYKIENISNGDHMYTLEVQQKNVSVTKTVVVRALNESKFYSSSNPSGDFKHFTIANFCVSYDSSSLFSLMLKTDNRGTKDEKTTIDHIGYSYTNDGFSGNWPIIELSDNEKEKLKPFATSPLLHMKSPGQLYGRLFFTGGSSLKVIDSSNSVAIVNLDADLGLRVVIVDNLPWASRTAHSCALFPHGDQNKIWLMGGVDEWGAALNDIWVSGDGKVWENIQANGSINQNLQKPAEMPWDKRCLAGVAVGLDDFGCKKNLLIGGGFSEIGGSETSDMWKWDKNHWEQLKDFTIHDSPYLSSGLFFLGKDALQSTGFYVLGGYESGTTKKKYFYKITLENGRYGSDELDNSSPKGLTTNRNSKIISGFFKGCLWYMVLTHEGDKGMTYSKLVYWIPVPTENTLILT
jgi:hypothetical protein